MREFILASFLEFVSIFGSTSNHLEQESRTYIDILQTIFRTGNNIRFSLCYIYESLIIGNFVSSLTGIPGSVVQAVASSIVFVIAGVAMDRYNVKKKMLGDCY